MEIMPKPRPPYLHRERNRHGTFVWYVRVNRKTPRIRLYANFGTVEFQQEYQAALQGQKLPKQGHRLTTGTVEWLVCQWKKSGDWHHSSEATKRQRENILDRVIAKNPLLPLSAVTPKAILNGREDRMKTPAAANNYLKTLRALFKWAMEAHPELIKENPASSVKLIPHKGEGFTPWTRDDVTAYQNRWPLGSYQRLWLELLLWTGLRRGDAVRLGRQHVRNNVACLKAEKTGEDLDIPMLPTLLEAIAASPTGDLAFICGEHGNPLTKESFGNMFRAACNAAGVKASAHGLRKLSATMAADSGATEKELQAYYGWKTNTQSQTYTRHANRKALAETMGKKLSENIYSRTSEKVRELENNEQQNQGDTHEKIRNGGR